MSKKWYVARAVSGQENKVVNLIQSMKETGDFPVEVGGVHIPVEIISMSRKGKQYQQKRRLIPGYFLMEIDFPDAGWHSMVMYLRNIDGFIGFASVTGKEDKPQPITEEEAKGLLDYGKGASKTTLAVKQLYAKGEVIKIVKGAFSSFNGTIVEVVPESELLRVEVEIFGRVTPIELEYDQVEKI